MPVALQLARVLPRPGPVWGDYPLRPADDTAPPPRPWRWRTGLSGCRQVARQAAQHALLWAAMNPTTRAAERLALRATLRRDGLQPAGMARALGLACVGAQEALGLTARPTQLLAAAVLLDNRMAEMATGEGKTLAIGLAAAVAALAGVPVHVVTANEYLAQRDAQTLQPLYQALGVRVDALLTRLDDADKRRVYGCDVVYATAKELAFDFLRDRQTLSNTPALQRVAANLSGQPVPAPLMRGLCMALLDEADSILLDEAEVPLILSRSAPHAARRAFMWQALALARQLVPVADFQVLAVERQVVLSPAGEAKLANLTEGLGGPWARPRYRREAIVIALAGLYVYHRNEHYVVRDEAIELLDDVTGRIAPGRVWSRGLHTVVALKEGLKPPADTETVAQMTFQRFFQRYWRLCGISGTLREAGAELQAVYGVSVIPIALHQASRRRERAPRRFASTTTLMDAVAERAHALSSAGRPVLIGTDSVADSQLLSQCLQQRGVAHLVLNALNDAEEAAIVASAGQWGRVTVATRMAGRGTDIELDDAARAAGGLHVLSCQNNASARLDRQLAGRAGRHGDPGSTEWWSLQAPNGLTGWSRLLGPRLSIRLLLAPIRWRQWREERRRRLLRRSLLEQDLHWEKRLSFAGSPS
jgi:preprotein translocase subunit SecA